MMDPRTQHALAQPFPTTLIKQREQLWTDRSGQKRRMVFDYVEVAAVIERLNTTFGYTWSFVVRESQRLDEKQVLVLGALTARDVTKTAYGGGVVSPGEEGMINAYKAAVGDAIKLCAKQFGIGLHLWMSD